MTEASQEMKVPISTGKRAELVAFAIIVAVIWPFVAVAVVGGFGFIIWMSQLILGPPGPPHQ